MTITFRAKQILKESCRDLSSCNDILKTVLVELDGATLRETRWHSVVLPDYGILIGCIAKLQSIIDVGY